MRQIPDDCEFDSDIGGETHRRRGADLAWEGCYNVRDLGGHPTSDGGTTQYGVVVRSDNPGRLTPRGVQAMEAYGIKTIVDLRDASETSAGPPIDTKGLDVESVVVPVLDFSDREFWEPWRDNYDPTGFYRSALARWPDRFAQAVAAVARARDGCVLVHCEAGRDRTGLVCALLLSLVGVSPDDIAADYALSTERLRTLYDQWISAARDDAEKEKLRRENVSTAQAMLDVLEGLDARAYLLDGGASEEDLTRVQARLRGPSVLSQLSVTHRETGG